MKFDVKEKPILKRDKRYQDVITIRLKDNILPFERYRRKKNVTAQELARAMIEHCLKEVGELK